MANTVTNTTLFTGNSQVIKYITIASDGSEETDLVIYDSSAIATTLGLTDTTNCRILSVYATASTAATARAFLEFDATTDVLALDLPTGQLIKNDFRPIGGLKNTSGTGKTGDITLTTTGLEAGDAITLILCVDPR